MLCLSQAEPQLQNSMEPGLTYCFCRRLDCRPKLACMLTHALLCRLSHSPSHSWNLS